MEFRKTAIPLIITAVLLTLALAGLSRWYIKHSSIPPHAIIVGTGYDPSSALIFVAYQKGFFRDEGLDVSLSMHTTGKASLQSMREGKAQFATVADAALMFAVLNQEEIFAIATIADSNKHHKIVGLKNRGISVPGDLKGKKIGVTEGTSGEFFLYTFLLYHGIAEDAVTIINMPPEDMEIALESGAIDAAATWYPTVSILSRNLRGMAVLFEDDTYLMTWNLVSQQNFAKKNSESVKKILKGLLKAQNYIKKEPGEAIAITAQFSRVDPSVLKDIWRNYNYNVRLGEGLLMNLEDESRWALNYYDTGRKTIPDFNDFIYTEGLRSINPASVTIRGNPER